MSARRERDGERRFDVLGDRCPARSVEDLPAPRGAETCRQIGVVEHALQRVGQRTGIPRRDEQPGHAVANGATEIAHVAQRSRLVRRWRRVLAEEALIAESR